MMTETDANQNWCPFTRVKLDDCGDTTPNRLNLHKSKNGVGIPNGATCIASDCMAWRWDKSDTDGAGCMKYEKGYCGLAGKP